MEKGREEKREEGRKGGRKDRKGGRKKTGREGVNGCRLRPGSNFGVFKNPPEVRAAARRGLLNRGVCKRVPFRIDWAENSGASAVSTAELAPPGPFG